MPVVRIITINFDGGDTTLRCLDSLMNLDYPEDFLDIVVVDNASVDGLVWKIPLMYPRVRVIESLTNEGFARGNNLAMQDLSGVDYVALINNDAIADPQWLRALVNRASINSAIGAVCSKMLFNRTVIGLDIKPVGTAVAVTDVLVDDRSYLHSLQFDERRLSPPLKKQPSRPEYWTSRRTSMWIPHEAGKEVALSLEVHASSIGEVQFIDRSATMVHSIGPETSRISVNHIAPQHVINNAGGGLFNGYFGGDLGFRELDLGQYEEAREVFSFCGGAVLLSQRMLRDVGLFDDSFFLYYEDLDLSWRARSKGWSIYYEPTAVVFHEHAFSSVEGSTFFRFWVDRNRRLTLIKNAPANVAIAACLSAFKAFALDILSVLRGGLRRRRVPLREILYRTRQLGSFVRAVPKAIRSRRAIRSTASLKANFVKSWITHR